MTTATEDIDTTRRTGNVRNLPVLAATKIFAGTIVEMDSTGFVVPATKATGKVYIGVCRTQADNSLGLDGAILAEIVRGDFGFNNSAAADEINRDDIGLDCFLEDDNTVALTNGTATRSILGKIYDIDEDDKIVVTVGTHA